MTSAAVGREDLERQLEVVRALAPGEMEGVFGPDSLTWRIDREALTFLGAGRALLLQLAHPWVAAAIAEHSKRDCHIAMGRARSVGGSGIVRLLRRRSAMCPSSDLQGLHPVGRTALSRLGLARRNRQSQRHPDCVGDRQGNQGAHLRGNQTHRIGRNFLQQVPRENCIGPSQAKRLVRDPAGRS
jgi:hypothetical protein